MVNKKLAKKAAARVMTVMLAGNIVALCADGSVLCRPIKDTTIMSGIVRAAEACVFSGSCVYVQNDADNPEPAVAVQPDGSVSVAMFHNTMIQLDMEAGASLEIVAGTDVAAVAMSPAGGLLIAGNQVGDGIIQVRDTASGRSAAIAVTVLPTSGSTTAQQNPGTVAGVHPGVQNGYYSYADDHKIVSTDGCLEINLDTLEWADYYSHPTIPKVYYAEDGMLTVEMYQGASIRFDSKCNLSGYRVRDSQDGKNGFMGSVRRPDRINNLIIMTGGRGVSEPIYHESAQIPVHIITIGGEYSDGAYNKPDDQCGYYPLSLTVR